MKKKVTWYKLLLELPSYNAKFTLKAEDMKKRIKEKNLL